MKQALIVVDVQKYFLKDAPSDLPHKIADHADKTPYAAIAFTVFKNSQDSNFVRSLNWSKCDTVEDARLPDVLKQHAHDDNVFTRDTYSGFSRTQIHSFLQSQGIEKIAICGVDTDACVLATAFSAFDLGYLIDVKYDLTFSSNELKNEALNIIKNNLVVQNKG